MWGADRFIAKEGNFEHQSYLVYVKQTCLHVAPCLTNAWSILEKDWTSTLLHYSLCFLFLWPSPGLEQFGASCLDKVMSRCFLKSAGAHTEADRRSELPQKQP